MHFLQIFFSNKSFSNSLIFIKNSFYFIEKLKNLKRIGTEEKSVIGVGPGLETETGTGTDKDREKSVPRPGPGPKRPIIVCLKTGTGTDYLLIFRSLKLKYSIY